MQMQNPFKWVGTLIWSQSDSGKVPSIHFLNSVIAPEFCSDVSGNSGTGGITKEFTASLPCRLQLVYQSHATWNYRNLKAAAASLGALCNSSPQTRVIKMTSQTGLNTTRACSALITSSLHNSLGSSVIDSIQKRDIQQWPDSPWWHSCYDAVSLLASLPPTRPLTRGRCFRTERFQYKEQHKAGFHL